MVWSQYFTRIEIYNSGNFKMTPVKKPAANSVCIPVKLAAFVCRTEKIDLTCDRKQPSLGFVKA